MLHCGGGQLPAVCELAVQRSGLSLFGIPVAVSLWHFVWMLVLLYNVDTGTMGPAGTVLLILMASFSVLAHEMGHAMVAKLFGLEPEIHLVSLGGITRHAPARKPWHEFVIVLAGPTMNFLLAANFQLVSPWLPDNARSITGWIIGINIVWGIYNLLPVWPMDGGNLMRIVFAKLLKPLIAARLTHGISIAVAVVIGLLLLRWGSLIGALFLAMSLMQNWRMLQDANDSPDAKTQRKHSRVRELIEQARQRFESGEFAEAARLGHLARSEAYLSQQELDHIWHLLALSEARLGNYDQSVRYAERLPNSSDMASVQAFSLGALGDAARIRRFLSSPSAVLLPPDRIEQLQERARDSDPDAPPGVLQER